MATEWVAVSRGGKGKAKSKTKESKLREAFDSTDEKANFQRCTRLLISGGTALLKEKFDQLCPPRDLPKILADPRTRNRLNKARLTKPQWDCLYPPRGAYGVSEDFDLTLLLRLLTTICKIPKPDLGWNMLPPKKEVSLGADLERIRCYRNEVYGHVKRMSLTDDEFKRYWDEIGNSFSRIAKSISPGKESEWKKEIESFKGKPLTADEERYVKELKRWYDEDTETKERLTKLEVKLETLKEDLNEIKEMLSQKYKCKVCGESECRGEDHKGVATLPICLDCPKIGSKRKAQDFLSGVRERYFNSYNPSTPEELNEFSHYMKVTKKVFIVDSKEGSLIITVGCGSVQVLDGLWNDYRKGHLGKMAQKYLVTAEVLNEFGLSEVNLTTDISEEEYRRCRQELELYSELEQKLAVVKGFRDGLQEKVLAWARMRESNVTLLREFLTQLRGFAPGRAGAMGVILGGIFTAFTSVPFLFGATAAGVVGATGVVLNKWDMQRKAKEEIIKERKVFDELQFKADSLRKPLAGLADFCRKHTDSVLSSRHLEGEFQLLSRILQKQEPEDPERTECRTMPDLMERKEGELLLLSRMQQKQELKDPKRPECRTLPNFIKEEVEVHYTSIRRPLELLSTSPTDEEIAEKISRILTELKVGPGEEEIRAMISNFIEQEFAANFTSRDG